MTCLVSLLIDLIGMVFLMPQNHETWNLVSVFHDIKYLDHNPQMGYMGVYNS